MYFQFYARTKYIGMCSNFPWNPYDNWTLNCKCITSFLKINTITIITDLLWVERKAC